MGARARDILIVEDDLLLSRLFRTAWTVAGYSVRHAADGLTALRMIDADPPALIVLDLVLPRVSGLSVQQEVAAHAHTRDIPVVIVTGSSIELGHLSVPCVLRKPVSPDELVEAVKKCLAGGAPGVAG